MAEAMTHANHSPLRQLGWPGAAEVVEVDELKKRCRLSGEFDQ
jgi:hypothetical protein